MKLLISILLLSIVNFTSVAQDAFSDDEVSIDLGLNLLQHEYEYGELSGLNFPVNVRLNYGKTDWLSIGPYAGFVQNNYDGFYGQFVWRIYTLGGQAKMHFVPILDDLFDIDIDDDKWDIFFLAGAGAEYWTFSSEEYRSLDGNFVDFNYTITLGLKYMFAEKWGLFAEGGRSAFGTFNIGISKTF